MKKLHILVLLFIGLLLSQTALAGNGGGEELHLSESSGKAYFWTNTAADVVEQIPSANFDSEEVALDWLCIGSFNEPYCLSQGISESAINITFNITGTGVFNGVSDSCNWGSEEIPTAPGFMFSFVGCEEIYFPFAVSSHVPEPAGDCSISAIDKAYLEQQLGLALEYTDSCSLYAPDWPQEGNAAVICPTGPSYLVCTAWAGSFLLLYEGDISGMNFYSFGVRRVLPEQKCDWLKGEFSYYAYSAQQVGISTNLVLSLDNGTPPVPERHTNFVLGDGIDASNCAFTVSWP